MTTILVAGAGALGSQIAVHLALPDRRFVVVDDDLIEEGNLWTTMFDERHLGREKSGALAMLLARKRAWAYNTKSTMTPVLLQSLIATHTPDLIVDTFDNFASRAIFNETDVPVVHAGVSEHLTGAVTWGNIIIPEHTTPRGENPVCTRDLGRGILRMTAAVAANVIEEFLELGVQHNYVTLTNGLIPIDPK